MATSALSRTEIVRRGEEIYERDLGEGSALKLPRGENRLVEHGGLMIALPTK